MCNDHEWTERRPTIISTPFLRAVERWAAEFIMCDERHTTLLELTDTVWEKVEEEKIFVANINNMTFIKCLSGMSRYQPFWALNIAHYDHLFFWYVRFFYSICCVAIISHFTSACCEWIFYFRRKKRTSEKIWFAIKIIIATRAQLLFLLSCVRCSVDLKNDRMVFISIALLDRIPIEFACVPTKKKYIHKSSREKVNPVVGV